MRAVMREAYASPDTLELVDIPVPEPADGEVRVAIRAVALNASDWEILVGRPIYSRIWGLLTPRFKILGSDIAGVVDSVGTGVDGFSAGDEVYGDVMGAFGGFADFACVPASMLRIKPPDLTFETAACLPQGGLIALQGCEGAALGKRMLINGAGGSGGSLAIQIAKARGAVVTGVDHGGKLDFMRQMGADHVVDYREQDYTENSYDVILDLVGGHPLRHAARATAKGGRYRIVGGPTDLILRTVALGPLWKLAGKDIAVLGLRPNEGLAELEQLVRDGTVRIPLDTTYPLEQTAEAIRRQGAGDICGKVVVRVN